MNNIKENNNINENINISINIDENIDKNININVNRNKNIDDNKDENIDKNVILSRLSLNSKSIKNVIDNINDSNFPMSENLYNELLKFDIHELLSIKANLEKADKVNFLVDEEKICKRFILDKDTTSMIVPMIAILISLFVLATNQKNILLQCLFGISIIILLILKYKFISIESKRSSKPTDNKYKVFQYLVDIAIENKKKELN